MYRLLQDDETILRIRKFRGNLEGVAICEAQYMAVDWRGEILSTCAHEMFHLLYPSEDNEKIILRLEREFMNAITERQARNLLFRIANKLK